MTASVPNASNSETAAAASELPSPANESGQGLAGLLAQLPDGLYVRRGAAMPEVAVRRVTEDSRAVGADTLFVAVEGLQQDGHRYIAQAVAAGARGCCRQPHFDAAGGTGLVASDCRRSLRSGDG